MLSSSFWQGRYHPRRGIGQKAVLGSYLVHEQDRTLSVHHERFEDSAGNVAHTDKVGVFRVSAATNGPDSFARDGKGRDEMVRS